MQLKYTIYKQQNMITGINFKTQADILGEFKQK